FPVPFDCDSPFIMTKLHPDCLRDKLTRFCWRHRPDQQMLKPGTKKAAKVLTRNRFQLVQSVHREGAGDERVSELVRQVRLLRRRGAVCQRSLRDPSKAVT